MDSLQVTEAIKLAVGCHYFPPGPGLPPQSPSITAQWFVDDLLQELGVGCIRMVTGILSLFVLTAIFR